MEKVWIRSVVMVCSMALLGTATAWPLVTAEEAARPAADSGPTHRALTRGPGVKLVSPDSASSKSPLSLKVAFEPRGGSKIKADSVKVTYLKSPLVDLSDRVKAGVSETGIELKDAELPPGDHQFKVVVEDSEGRQTNTLISLKIVR